MREEAERDRDRLQRLATVLQRSLLPPRLPDVPGIETAAYYHPASLDEVGGDFYDLFPAGRRPAPSPMRISPTRRSNSTSRTPRCATPTV